MKKLTSHSFTLVEILVVITIFSILLAIGGFSYSAALKTSRDAKRKADLEQIRAALELYRSDNGQYITYTGGCAGLPATNYLPVIPPDPVSATYQYYCNIAASTYTLAAFLENGAVNCAATDCSVAAGSLLCKYTVGPYGTTCGP